MRPPEFTGGNLRDIAKGAVTPEPGFNEAAGIHRRKHRMVAGLLVGERWASMRPPEFTGGNDGSS